MKNPFAAELLTFNKNEAQEMVKGGCHVVIAGNFGPMMAHNLGGAGVEMFTAPRMKAIDALHCYLQGELAPHRQAELLKAA